MGFYNKFSEKDLLEAYKNQIDYQGEANAEILAEIEKRGSFEDFQLKLKNKQSFADEKNRIIREIHSNYMNFLSKEECSILINSEIISEDEKKELIEQKYSQISYQIENLKIDRKTIVKSIIGTFFSSIITFLILVIFTKNFSFILISFLVPVYIANYLIIRLITGKTRSNLAVFLASFFATLLSIFYFFMVFDIFA